MNSLYRTMFFVPGNDPKKIIGAEIYQSDCIIYDLEDSVSVYEKDSARILVKYALQNIRPDCRIGVRINGNDTPFYAEDVACMVPLQPDFLRLPKSETAEDVQRLDREISQLEAANNMEPGSVKIVASIESAFGMRNAYEIATASSRVLAICLGAEDFRTDMGVQRTEGAEEILFARSMLAFNAHAAGVKAMDYIFSNVKNEEGFREDVKRGKILGFTGKSVIHPDQISIVQEIYTPTAQEIENAQAVLAAYEEAMRNASGVVSLNGKMIDAPIVKRASNVIACAKAIGIEV